MSDATGEVVMIPVEAIVVVNPRIRNKKSHRDITENIQRIGLKRPIEVRRMPGEPGKYALVCGQGRLESFKILGQREIPAIVLDVDEDTGLIMGIVENVARRNPLASEMLAQVDILRKKGYSDAEIGKKIGYTASWVNMVGTLLEKGEKRLLVAAEAGHISLHLAIEISRASDSEAQHLLLAAVNSGEIKGKKVAVIRRILEQRSLTGKAPHDATSRSTKRKKLSSEDLMRLYQREADRHKLIQLKAERVSTSLLVVNEIFKDLFADAEFVDLIRDEGLVTVPQPLAATASRGGLI
ncbi:MULTISPECIES: ParB/RepB/Spo0J family partition protein [Burkholderia]|uniref:ParB/RepB/Spo0J family partition protein n=1 Tax=Burkholderia TaxID=32008 RepID=UPI0006683224|nr:MULTISPECIES: plasmid partitioning protein RepB C-terminal domain-containing protein [Burkholderia]MCW3503959.1 ParB N-terminal domain-containing protein [Burkholderia cenocepacia]MCW3511244.1 ParB N-terminal domain-containing protein [Burkholderia cenocepacia]MCW3519068.1 ParB N-terminal domain-containing protein [Burkholderia cenocepacia]MCW3534295.1 ParB N-terminal domain-containing protein [Burkholderia cenocepacia]MCW3549477.1 ParB N-terminal domain-containing protein [Burkholderia cen